MDKELIEKLAEHMLSGMRSVPRPVIIRLRQDILAFLDKEGYVILKKDALIKKVGLIRAEELGVTP